MPKWNIELGQAYKFGNPWGMDGNVSHDDERMCLRNEQRGVWGTESQGIPAFKVQGDGKESPQRGRRRR